MGFEELPCDSTDGLEHDFQIEQERHVVEIEQIHRNHLTKRRFVLAVHLPISGQPGQGVHTFVLPGFVFSKFVWQTRSRANQTHLPAKHVENLR